MIREVNSKMTLERKTLVDNLERRGRGRKMEEGEIRDSQFRIGDLPSNINFEVMWIISKPLIFNFLAPDRAQVSSHGYRAAKMPMIGKNKVSSAFADHVSQEFLADFRTKCQPHQPASCLDDGFLP